MSPGDTSPTVVGERVLNYDGLWTRGARWYRIGDVSLGRRGVPQAAVAYALAGVAFVALVRLTPLLGDLVAATLPPLVWALAPVLVFAGLGMVSVQEDLPLHIFAGPLLAHLTTSRHLLGWVPVSDPTRLWKPGRLVLEQDGSAGRFPAAVFTGPGELVRNRPAQRTRPARRLGRGRVQVLAEKPGPALTQPRVLEVPAGVRVRIQPLQTHTHGEGS